MKPNHEVAVNHRTAHLCQQVRPSGRSAHLLTFAHSDVDQLADGRLRCRFPFNVSLWKVNGDVHELVLDRSRWRDAACDLVRRELMLQEWTALVLDAALKPGCATFAAR